MSVDTEGVYQAARSVRPHLERLVGPRVAAERDREFAQALADPPSEAGAARLLTLFGRSPATGDYLAAVLADAPRYRPPYDRAEEEPEDDARGGEALGDAGFVEAESQWVCPRGDFRWFSPELGTPVPPCATPGHPPLVPVP
ncbi:MULTISPECIES: hypothetical protein [unclassified Streptomyces]|uniref:hypothetical protein n=1 Tax=unclassified Streptomyces TaxID=2593676 RepID=UPI00224FEC34|nr:MULTISPECIES: hypothetical protein [unclassified Streptomyces]MCX4524093.1 hypothetical protein [Streptomyces sp. NBC_01551]MCX4545389.1 hypothetical protein [Streptomyces sp. NBC_01565]